MTESQSQTIERLNSRVAIQDVLHRYCRAIDRIQPDLLATVFHSDALIDNGPYKGNVGGFIANVAERHPTVPYASHMVMNELIDFLGTDKAFVESWCLAMEQHMPVEGKAHRTDHVIRVRYGDIFERRSGEWRIAHRMTVIDHMMSVPTDPTIAPDFGERIWGRRDKDDPVIKMRAELGLKSVD